MKFRTCMMLCLCLTVLAPGTGIAGVAGSKHDMYKQKKGDDPNVCNYCHVPHNAAGEMIWSNWGNENQLIGGPSTPVGNMCYTCHDGTVTGIGVNTVFDNVLQQHSIGAGFDCDWCHSVHDNANGMFMLIGPEEDSYCAACHSDVHNAANLGDHTNAGNHPSYWTTKPAHDENGSPTGAACLECHYDDDGKGNDGSCHLCHRVHGAADYSTDDIKKPILRKDNTDSAFCADCHPRKEQTEIGGLKHPANLVAAGDWGVVSCQECHDVHQPDHLDYPFQLKDKNVDSAYCMYCHSYSDNTNGPLIGSGHPVGVPFSVTPTDPDTAPAGNTIDDDDVNGIDYPANSASMVCESCHSVHRKNVEAGLLRVTQAGSAFCINCHNNF